MTANRRGFRQAARLVATVACVVVATKAAHAHPFHYTLAEVEWKPAAGRLEVALRVSLIDLEPAIRERTSGPVDLESTDGDELLAAWAAETFEVALGEERLPLVWIGREIDRRDAWLYFTFELTEPTDDLTFQARLFFDREPTQQNIVRFRAPGFDETLRCTANEPEIVFEQAALRLAFDAAAAAAAETADVETTGDEAIEPPSDPDEENRADGPPP